MFSRNANYLASGDASFCVALLHLQFDAVHPSVPICVSPLVTSNWYKKSLVLIHPTSDSCSTMHNLKPWIGCLKYESLQFLLVALSINKDFSPPTTRMEIGGYAQASTGHMQQQ
jgi:hypothetical protein